MPAYKLYYFNSMGRAEVSRLLFAESQTDYEDYRFKDGEWPTLKDQMPFGQAPVLEVNGKKLSQSMAIARYLANEFGLAGKTNWEKAEADSIVDGIGDIFPKIGPVLFEKDPEKRKEIYAKVEAEFLKPFIGKYENFLEKNGTGYFVGKELTWADLCVFQMFGFLRSKHPETFKDSKKICDFIDRIGSRDRIKEWVDKRPKTDM